MNIDEAQSLDELATVICQWREEKGFHTPSSIEETEEIDQMLGKMMLVVSEVSEATEAARHADPAHFKEEIADTFIRLLDICGTMDLNIEEAIKTKMKVNMSRDYRHGKEASL